MPVPAFFAIAIAAGALTIGATATDAKKFMGTDKNFTTARQTFYNTRFTGPADCLTAAVSVKAPIEACAFDETMATVVTPRHDGKPETLRAFDPSRFASAADCLNAAARAGVSLQACASDGKR